MNAKWDVLLDTLFQNPLFADYKKCSIPNINEILNINVVLESKKKMRFIDAEGNV